MMNDRIELKATKLPEEISAICCVVCGRVSERPLMAAEGEAEGEDIVICPRCLSEGDIDAKLEHHAAELDKTGAVASRSGRAARSAIPCGAQGVRQPRRHRASSGVLGRRWAIFSKRVSCCRSIRRLIVWRACCRNIAARGR